MYGAMIGDIVGSKYEFNNIKTKEFPLFSAGCDFTDDTIMTVAVAKAILLSRKEHYGSKSGAKGFQDFLIETMQDFGRRYPDPTGAYGGRFQNWLREKDPKPYGSYGNGSAMRVSPCGLAAVTMEEALILARASACVSHNHPEGVKGAEAVAAAIFLAKCGASKEEIRRQISENYYELNFTLDEIRDSYRFDGSCQGTVPQAIAAFLESVSFEDAIRNIVSIGGDSDTAAAITGSIAWTYYAVQTGGYSGWVYDKFDPAMLEIKNQAISCLPEEFVTIADEFHEVCWRRGGTFARMGGCTPIVNAAEYQKYGKQWGKQPEEAPARQLTPAAEAKLTAFCGKYLVLLQALSEDRELNEWCRQYSAYKENKVHKGMERLIYDGMMKEAYSLGVMPEILAQKAPSEDQAGAAAKTRFDLAYDICREIRMDYGSNGYLIGGAVAEGRLYRLMKQFLETRERPASAEPKDAAPAQAAKQKVHGGKAYSLAYVESYENAEKEDRPGGRTSTHDASLRKWRMRIQLDEKGIWYLSVFVRDDGGFEKYALDRELAGDSHYEFKDEAGVRKSVYAPGDEARYLAEVLIRCVKQYGGDGLLKKIYPFVTAQFHFD